MRSIIIAVIVILTCGISHGQHMRLSLLSEYTVAGPQYGASMAVETKKKLGLGLFYQADVRTKAETGVKDTFYGAEIHLPIARADKLNFFGTIRGGLVNDRFAVMVPGFETRLNAGKRLTVGFAMSMRMNYPSVLGKISCRIF